MKLTQAISTAFLVAVMALLSSNVTAQDFTPIDVPGYPWTDSNISSNGGYGPATGMQGTCNTIPCCSMVVYRFEIPLRGSFRIEMTPFDPLANSILVYKSTVENTTLWSELQYVSSPGNFCGFRDTCQIGRAYTWTAANPMWVADTSTVFEPTVAAGQYYALVFTQNDQTSQGLATNHDITFDYRPYCPDGYSCGTDGAVICDGSPYTAPSGAVFDSTGAYIDTLIGGAVGGLDSLIFINLRYETPSTYVDSSNVDTTLACGGDYEAIASTEQVSIGTFNNSDNDWVNIDVLADSLAGSNRSVFMWMQTQSSVSSSNDCLFAINTSGGGNVSLMWIGTNEKLGINHGTSTIYGTSTITNNGWHYVGYTYEDSSGETKIWVDGVLENTFTNSQTASASDQISLGQEYDNSSKGNYFKGDMAEVTVWTEVLDSAAIAELMAKGPSPDHTNSADLLAYYPFASSSCPASVNMLEDFSGNGYDGTASADDIYDPLTTQQIVGANAAPAFGVEWSSSTAGVFGSGYTETITGGEAGTITTTFSRGQVSVTSTFDVTAPVDLSVTETGGTDLTANQDSAMYQWLDCDNNYAVVGGATSATLTGMTGNFAVEVTYNGCTDTSACFAISSASCPAMDFSSMVTPIVTDAMARMVWDTVAGATGYRLWYKQAGGNGWATTTKAGQQGRKEITGLTALTNYKWMLQSRCGTVWGPLSPEKRFTTLAAPCPSIVDSTMTADPIQATQVRLNWDAVAGVHKYRIRYRQVGTSSWNVIPKDNTWTKHWLTGLSTGTMYEWQMRTQCKEGKTTTVTPWSSTKTFSTNANKTATVARSVQQPLAPLMVVFPNPASDYLNIGLTAHSDRADVMLVDVTGKVVFQTWYPASAGPDMQTIETSNLSGGVYFLIVRTNGRTDRARVVVQ